MPSSLKSAILDSAGLLYQIKEHVQWSSEIHQFTLTVWVGEKLEQVLKR